MFKKINTYVLLVCMIMCGCFKEGSDLANKSFSLMSSTELMLYRAVALEPCDVDGVLYPVREAVIKYRSKPRSEDQIPFGDIAKVIVMNNNVTLKDRTGGYAKYKWSAVDPVWFEKITKIASGKTVVKKKVIKNKTVVKKKVIKKKSKSKKTDLKKKVQSVSKQPTKAKLVPKDEYDEIIYNIKGCDEATDLFERITDSRPLNVDDKNILIELSLMCKAREAADRL